MLLLIELAICSHINSNFWMLQNIVCCCFCHLRRPFRHYYYYYNKFLLLFVLLIFFPSFFRLLALFFNANYLRFHAHSIRQLHEMSAGPTHTNTHIMCVSLYLFCRLCPFCVDHWRLPERVRKHDGVLPRPDSMVAIGKRGWN